MSFEFKLDAAGGSLCSLSADSALGAPIIVGIGDARAPQREGGVVHEHTAPGCSETGTDYHLCHSIFLGVGSGRVCKGKTWAHTSAPRTTLRNSVDQIQSILRAQLASQNPVERRGRSQHCLGAVKPAVQVGWTDGRLPVHHRGESMIVGPGMPREEREARAALRGIGGLADVRVVAQVSVVDGMPAGAPRNNHGKRSMGLCCCGFSDFVADTLALAVFYYPQRRREWLRRSADIAGQFVYQCLQSGAASPRSKPRPSDCQRDQ